MDLKAEIKAQYHAGLAMLADCIEKCPDDLWVAPSGAPDKASWGGLERSFWRIAFHALYFTQLYMGQGETTIQAPPASSAVGGREDLSPLWRQPLSTEPYELPLRTPACSRADLREYLSFVDSLVGPTLDGLDLVTPNSGFPWYPKMSKLGHELMNLRHIQGHVGQLSELLMQRGIDTVWVGQSAGL